MLRLLYRVILRLYPADVRRAHGAEMEAVFLHCVRTEQGRMPRVLWPLVWLRGVVDALAFALAARRPARRTGWRGTLAHDARWVVRGLRARGWSAVLAMALMAIAMGASALAMPLETFSSAEQRQLTTRLFQELSALPYVRSAAPILGGAPPGNAETMRSAVEVDAGGMAREDVIVRAYVVAPAFFPTVGVTARGGRLLQEGDPPSNVVVTETFARYLWGSGDPVGRAFRLSEGAPWSTVVGVVPHVRTELDRLGGPNEGALVFFRPPPPAPSSPPQAPAPPAAPRPVANVPPGPLYSFSTILVRLSEPSRAADLLGVARSIDPRARYSVESLDAAYASRHAETRAATTIISAFAGVAFFIAVAGVFGVMTVLVSSRTREIGIRMAIGADPWRVRRMVLRSSVQIVTAGVVIGTAAALGLSRFIESQLFGVTPHDPLTFAVVAGLLLSAAMLATWHPAGRAARVDPVVTLRAE